jgi:hypothetical protein
MQALTGLLLDPSSFLRTLRNRCPGSAARVSTSAKNIKVHRRLIVLVAIGLVLSVCVPTAESVSIHRFSAVAETRFPPLDRTINDPAIACHLYEHLRSLRPFEENGTVFCAFDFGARHELSFYARGERVLHGVLEMGCRFIDLGAGDRRSLDDSFEAELLGAVGLYTRGNDLWPTPIPRP